MKLHEIKLSLEHDDLVDLLSGATYGSTSLSIKVTGENLKTYKESKGESWEDKLADVLMAGGRIDIIDTESDVESITEAYSDLAIGLENADGWSGTYKCVIYGITLKDIEKGCSSEEGFKLLQDVISGEGDMWDAYNLMQLIMFGEIIYG